MIRLSGIAAGFAVMLLIAPASISAQDAAAATDVTSSSQSSQVTGAQRRAASELINLIMPPSSREAMLATMIEGQMTMVRNNLMNVPAIKSALERSPGARSVFDRFVARQTQFSVETITERLPGMIEAMSEAYARRFTLEQLQEMSVFFQSPTGQRYVEQSTSIMNDPAIAAWQSGLMRATFARLPEEMRRLRQELDAVEGQ
jgi:hypothetical protein